MSATLPTRAELISLARAAATAHSLDPALVCAVVEQESAWNPWAIRYEPGFLARYVAPLFTAGKISATEAYARSFSWGLMQIMGQVAREHGFGAPHDVGAAPFGDKGAGSTGASSHSDPSPGASCSPALKTIVIPSEARDLLFSVPNGASLAQLCDPATGLDVGCAVLAHKFASAGATKSGDGATTVCPMCSAAVPGGSVGSSVGGSVTVAGAPHAVIACGFSPDVIYRALQLWNGGANPDYAAQVLARVKNYM